MRTPSLQALFREKEEVVKNTQHTSTLETSGRSAFHVRKTDLTQSQPNRRLAADYTEESMWLVKCINELTQRHLYAHHNNHYVEIDGGKTRRLLCNNVISVKRKTGTAMNPEHCQIEAAAGSSYQRTL